MTSKNYEKMDEYGYDDNGDHGDDGNNKRDGYMESKKHEHKGGRSDGRSDEQSKSILQRYIERIERLNEEKDEVAKQVRDVYAEAKGDGFDARIMRMIIKLRKMKPHEVMEQDMLLETYKRAVGMASDQD